MKYNNLNNNNNNQRVSPRNSREIRYFMSGISLININIISLLIQSVPSQNLYFLLHHPTSIRRAAYDKVTNCLQFFFAVRLCLFFLHIDFFLLQYYIFLYIYFMCFFLCCAFVSLAKMINFILSLLNPFFYSTYSSKIIKYIPKYLKRYSIVKGDLFFIINFETLFQFQV